MPFPLIVIPWAHIQHDNHRLMLSRRHGRLITAPDYRAAKDNARYYIQKAWRGLAMLETPLQVRITLWYPDLRKRDCASYNKLIHDAMTGVVMRDDSLFHRVISERGGLDRNNPRAEVLVSHYQSQAA